MAFKMKGFPKIQGKQSKETPEATADPKVGKKLADEAYTKKGRDAQRTWFEKLIGSFGEPPSKE